MEYHKKYKVYIWGLGRLNNMWSCTIEFIDPRFGHDDYFNLRYNFDHKFSSKEEAEEFAENYECPVTPEENYEMLDNLPQNKYTTKYLSRMYPNFKK